MNKNIENYKKAVEQIHVNENLKDKVLEQTKEKTKKRKLLYYLRYAVCVTATLVVAVVGISFYNKPKSQILNIENENNLKYIDEEKDVDLENVSIKRFKNIEELREKLKENYNSDIRGSYNLSNMELEDVRTSSDITKSAQESSVTNLTSEKSDYSKTNNQVENVDEADIVKTDGKYIYYSQNNMVYIVDKDLNIKSTIKDNNFRPSQIFINKEKLVIFGNILGNYNVTRKEIDSFIEEDVAYYGGSKTCAKVFDIKNVENPELVREVSIDGNYRDARMIDDNIYFVSNYGIHFYRGIDELKDEEILPSYKDSVVSKEDKTIDIKRIACFDDSKNYEYSIIAGFNLNSNEEVNIETFFGFGSEIYASENNMYLICTKYANAYLESNTVIYKFKLENSSVKALASCEVEGNTNNQFSIDEYDGNLRVATTVYKYDMSLGNELAKTKLTIFDENLKEIGGIDNLIEDERIYAVRFIGKVGYIVTFEQVDPLWVIDLSNPRNPVVKGELEIPGYSSYLHPYDETHIIGIGYDVKSNGYGGVKNDKMKLSMFDVSDLENPKEIFKINFGNESVYSNIIYEHKALFFNKNENLIGFPVTSWSYKNNKRGMLLYRIDLENNKFEEITELLDSNKNFSPERAIYMGNDIYVLYYDMIKRYDMNTFENIGELSLKTW